MVPVHVLIVAVSWIMALYQFTMIISLISVSSCLLYSVSLLDGFEQAANSVLSSQRSNRKLRNGQLLTVLSGC